MELARLSTSQELTYAAPAREQEQSLAPHRQPAVAVAVKDIKLFVKDPSLCNKLVETAMVKVQSLETPACKSKMKNSIPSLTWS